MKAYPFTLKSQNVKGFCLVQRCWDPTHGRKGKWCEFHRAEVRRCQLAANNRVWLRRKQAGRAGHRPVYNGKPTRWVLEQLKPEVREVLKLMLERQ